MSCEEASGGGDKGEVGMGNQGEDQIVNNGHGMRRGMVFEVGLFFMPGDIARVMQAVFNVPVGAQHL